MNNSPMPILWAVRSCNYYSVKATPVPTLPIYSLLEIHWLSSKTAEIYDDFWPKDFHFCTALILSAYFNHLNITKGHMQETASVKTNTLIIPSLVKCLPWLSVAISKLLPWFPTIGLVKTPDCVAWNNIFINCFFSGLTLLSGSQFCHM